MKIHTVEQNSADWFLLRVGRVTASELDSIVTPKFEQRKGETPYTYLCKKLAEAYKGRPLGDDDFSTYDSEVGQILEDEARRLFCFEFKPKGERFIDTAGFVEGDDGRCGCSPDALIGETSGVEIKCPKFKTHVKYLLNGTAPDEYLAQIHGSLFVTGRPSWYFMSYARGFPPFVLKVERDEAICAKIQEALTAFYARFDAALAQMKGHGKR